MHEQKSDFSSKLESQFICNEKQLSTYKWHFLRDQRFDQFVNVFRNRRPVDRAKGNLKKKNYVVQTQKKGKDLTKNTDFLPCCASISPRNVSNSTFVLSSLFCDSMP